MPPKRCCCVCVDPPECTLTATGGGTPGGNITLTWTTTGADTVTIYDDDATLISSAKNGTSVLVSGGACKTYTLTATNDCGETICEYDDPCPSEHCGLCEDNAPSTFTVTLVNNGVNDPDCCNQVTNESDRCDQFDGSFTVSSAGGNECEWVGGPFGTAWTCRFFPTPLSRPQWYLRIKVQYGDCDGNNMSDIYAIVGVTYVTVDPEPCPDFMAYQKLLGEDVDLVDCLALIPGGTYTQCAVDGVLITSQLCDVDLSVS